MNYAGRAGFASGSYLSGDARDAVMAPSAQAYGPAYGYVDRGGPGYDSYAYDNGAYDNRSYDNEYDADGYPSAEAFHFSFARPRYDEYRGGHQDW